MKVLVGSQITDEELDNCPPGSVFTCADSVCEVATSVKDLMGRWVQVYFSTRDNIVKTINVDADSMRYDMEKRMTLFIREGLA